MLLSGLQCHSHSRIAISIFGHANNTPRNVSFVRFFGGKESGMWPSVAQRNTKTLRGAHNDVNAPFPRRGQQHQTQNISGNGNLDIVFLGLLGKGGFYPQSQHIPLVIAGPGVAAGAVVEAFTSPVDVFPTLAESYGTEPAHAPDGQSLWPFLRGETPAAWRDGAIWEFDFRGLLEPEVRRAMGLGTTDCSLICRMTERALYVQSRAFAPLLFDLEADPECLTDVADTARELRLEAAEALIRARIAHNDNTLADTVLTADGPVRRG